MTQIVKKNTVEEIVAKKQTALLNPEVPGNADIAAQIVNLRAFMSGEKSEGGIDVPRFGLLSLKMAYTPMYAYDHPDIVAKCSTAFTDGMHIFIHSKFLEQLNKESDLTAGEEYGAEPLVLHELTHMLLNHVNRLKQFPHDIANRAEDLVINSKLRLSFPEMKWVPSLRELGLAFQDGDVEKYSKLSEETVAQMLMEEQKKDEKKKKKDKDQDQNSGKGSGGSGPSGESGGSPSDDADPEMNHTWSPEELVDTFEKAGLGGVLEKLNYPTSTKDEDFEEKIGKMNQDNRNKDIESVRQAAQQKAKMGGKYPGAHIVDACAEVVKGFSEHKLTWKLGTKEFLLGGGMRLRYSDEEAWPLFYVTKEDTGFDEVYLGSDIPQKPDDVILVLIDTSGSVDTGMLKEFLGEVFGLMDENNAMGDSASEVVVIAADTVVRGQPLILTRENADEWVKTGVPMAGRGGTDLGEDLRQTMALDIFKEKKISAVVFMTDLCDAPPTKEDFPSELPLCFVTCHQTMNEEFAKRVKSFARVYAIEKGTEIDLTEDHLSTPVNTRKAKV